MHEILLLCLSLILSVSFLVVLSKKLKVAYPIFLVIAGLVISFIPGIPDVQINPDLVFLIILPPVLYDAAQNTSWKALWKWRRIIIVMALGFVLLTAGAVAWVSWLLIPGFTLAQGFLLGAIISPPDAAAATSVLQFTKLPKGMVAILEGESLLNDASSLVIFRFALAAIISSSFVWYNAAGGFVLVTLSGIAIGLVLGLVFYAIYRWVPTNSNLDIAFALVLPYLIYLAAETVHSSGVLAVVTGGLFISYKNHYVLSHSSRLKSNAVWPSIVFMLNAVVFFLIGLQLPGIIEGVKAVSMGEAFKIALIITGVVILVRLVSALFSAVFTKFISRYITVAQNKPGWRNPVVLSWVGMRGVVSLASALSIPLMLNGHPFPNRNLILFITFMVIIITLVGQGFTLPLVIKWIKPGGLENEKTDEQQLLEIEMQLYSAAVAKLSDEYKTDLDNNTMLKSRHELFKYKVELFKASANDAEKRAETNEMMQRFKKVMMEVMEHERTALHTFRTNDAFDDDIIRIIENRLDLEEERLQEEGD
ncbi:Na+/H+ antiporter [Mucilaginibacter sp. ZT4R22]|uniref:Na+/H+ antiporter n=1 Tax=Mucilaginibacter pankratovii TaxID=2772110 RepID=A0ABR7WLY9_9SPHI|nr:Na+/H+ antiporter [Mucilaginibacter pankratovii]MBD1363327.1 Na+/H+ antiporter [Mucilaginibacter pankratovii]